MNYLSEFVPHIDIISIFFIFYAKIFSIKVDVIKKERYLRRHNKQIIINNKKNPLKNDRKFKVYNYVVFFSISELNNVYKWSQDVNT